MSGTDKSMIDIVIEYKFSMFVNIRDDVMKIQRKSIHMCLNRIQKYNEYKIRRNER